MLKTALTASEWGFEFVQDLDIRIQVFRKLSSFNFPTAVYHISNKMDQVPFILQKRP